MSQLDEAKRGVRSRIEGGIGVAFNAAAAVTIGASTGAEIVGLREMSIQKIGMGLGGYVVGAYCVLAGSVFNMMSQDSDRSNRPQ